MKKVLVTGAGGFVGRHVIEYLQNQGYDVIGMLREKKEGFQFPFIIHDLVKPIMISDSFDVIVHAAGSLPYNQKDFREFKKNNIDSMNNIIVFAKEKNIKRVIYLSTIGVHGEFRKDIINENSDIINQDYYGLTKYVAELLLRSEDHIESISIRMPGIIGLGASGGWLPNIVEKFKRNEDVTIYSPTFKTKNFVYIQDLVNFIETLIETEKFEKNVVMLACSKGETIQDIVQKIKNIMNSTSNIIVEDSTRKSFCIDNTSAIKMGYKSMEPFNILDVYCK